MTYRSLTAVVALGLLAIPALSQAAISDLYGAAAGTVTVTGTVQSVIDTYPTTTPTKNSFILSDGTGSILAYSIPIASYTAVPGDVVTITTTNTPYQGAPELTATGFTVSVSGNTGAPTPVTLTASQLTSTGGTYPLAESYATLKNVLLVSNTTGLPITTLATKTAYHIVDASNVTDIVPGSYTTGTLYTYTSYSGVAAAVTAANASTNLFANPVDLTGFVNSSNGLLELEPTSITASVAAPEPAALSLLAGAGLLVGRRRRA